MNRPTPTDEHNKALRRIAAVLLALADLAERASGRSLAVRCLVLWLLRSAETLARDHLAVLTCHAAAPSEPFPFTHDGATEAIRLAISFRNLAAALAALMSESPMTAPEGSAARYGALTATDPLAVFHGLTVAVKRLDSS